MMTKRELIARENEISSMGFNELTEFKRVMAMSNIDETDPKASFYIRQAIEVREIELRNREDATVENGELRGCEI